MHIVDISALYSPQGGGIRTYTHRKLEVAEQHGVRLTVVVPGADDHVREVGKARLVSIKSPRFPLDRSYFYFASDRIIHAALDEHRPDFIECSSPWGSAAAVADWPGAAPRSLFMHAEPLSAWVYRYLDGLLPRQAIDRGFDWFWRYLRRLDARYDQVISAAPSLSKRLRDGGLTHVVDNALGVDPGVFSPANRDEELRKRLLAQCGLPPDATLLIGVGRHSPEKQWPMVIAGVTAASYGRPLGMIILGDGHARASVVRAVGENPHIQLIAPVRDRAEFARILASADMMVHGAPAETFGIACAEAKASGLPLIVPDQGAALDQLEPGLGLSFTSLDAASLAGTIADAIPMLPAMRSRAIAAATGARTIDEHFAQLFAGYAAVLDGRRAA
ncbi:glycosyltransferase [Sandarakinorhabdus oryzae]|uniref:glycosyltransferase n=1 Tax=Sandarakinorhabdus oryzae TaxID=2675220 RepID=UPI0012E1AB77|nr:glycosyltransferase [Sandarakinorhabdus oryzae]